MAEIQSSFLHCTIAAIPADFLSVNGLGDAADRHATVANWDVPEPQGVADSRLPARGAKCHGRRYIVQNA
jgi:hypothetical protein